MSDLIERQAAIDTMCLACGHDCDKSKFVYNAPQDEQIIMCPEHYALSTLPSAQPEPCEDAVSRVDVLECFSDLYDTFEDCSKGIVNELHRKFEDLRTLPSVTPKSQEYKTDHGYMWICPDCGLVVHSDFKKCVRCGHKREE